MVEVLIIDDGITPKRSLYQAICRSQGANVTIETLSHLNPAQWQKYDIILTDLPGLDQTANDSFLRELETALQGGVKPGLKVMMFSDHFQENPGDLPMHLLASRPALQGIVTTHNSNNPDLAKRPV